MCFNIYWDDIMYISSRWLEKLKFVKFINTIYSYGSKLRVLPVRKKHYKLLLEVPCDCIFTTMTSWYIVLYFCIYIDTNKSINICAKIFMFVNVVL